MTGVGCAVWFVKASHTATFIADMRRWGREVLGWEEWWSEARDVIRFQSRCILHKIPTYCCSIFCGVFWCDSELESLTVGSMERLLVDKRWQPNEPVPFSKTFVAKKPQFCT